MSDIINIVHCAISEVGKRLLAFGAGVGSSTASLRFAPYPGKWSAAETPTPAAGRTRQLFIVCDRNVRNLAEMIGIEADGIFEIDATEDNKDISTVVEINRWLMENGADREALLLGIGGGITTDMTGFAASVYKRGIRFAFVPTTLLSQVDAAIGGKTGVNLDSYKNMIGKSLMQKGNIHRLKAAIDKARRGEKTYVSFIGGSITQGAGAIPINTECYAYKAFKGFCDIAGRGYDDNVIYTKAGVGGTPSEVGILRYEADVLHYGERTPDVVVVEFAVNDEGDETKGEFFDSLVRRIYNSPQKPAVVLLYAVFVDGYNLQDRLKCVGEAYNLPMVSIRDAVYDQFYLNEEEGGVVSKNRYFYDMYHPTNVGHRIMADGLINMFRTADGSDDEADLDISDITPPKGAEFESIYLVDRANIDSCPAVISYDMGGFDKHSDEVQHAERDLDAQVSPEFPNNWLYDCSGETVFRARMKFSALVIAYMDSASIDVGCRRGMLRSGSLTEARSSYCWDSV